MKSEIQSIDQKVVNKIQEKEQALNGWIAIDSTGIATATGHFSGVKVLAGDTATISITSSLCNTNGVTIDLVEGDYLPTPKATSITASAGKCILMYEIQ